MPTIYNGGQSPLEEFAINGNPLYPGSGRLAIISQSKIGLTKYDFGGSYKNPAITGNPDDAYGITHTNAVADSDSPYLGRGTGDGISQGVFGAINNYSGGNIEDINGTVGVQGSGRNPLITLNAGTWGYGPTAISGEKYVAPDTSLNVGQVIF